jgi:acyl-CoA thioesterase I
MARGCERKAKRRRGAAVLTLAAFGAVFGCALLGAQAWAQGNAVSPPAPAPAPFSRDCQAGATATASDSPLPNVAAALAKHKKIKILAIGASASAGRGARHGGYTGEARQILRQAIKGLDVVLINRGVSGELASQAATRIKNEVALLEPDMVLWQVGTNDALAYVPVDEIRASVVDTLNWLKEHNIDTVLVGLQYVDRMEQDEHYKKVREMLREVAAEQNVLIVRRYEAQRLLSQAAVSGGGLYPDEFQRTEAGYTCLAQYMARAITLGIFGPGGLGPPGAPPAIGPRPRQAPPSVPSPRM